MTTFEKYKWIKSHPKLGLEYVSARLDIFPVPEGWCIRVYSISDLYDEDGHHHPELDVLEPTVEGAIDSLYEVVKYIYGE